MRCPECDELMEYSSDEWACTNEECDHRIHDPYRDLEDEETE